MALNVGMHLEFTYIVFGKTIMTAFRPGKKTFLFRIISLWSKFFAIETLMIRLGFDIGSIVRGSTHSIQNC